MTPIIDRELQRLIREAKDPPADVTALVWADLLREYTPQPTHTAPEVLQ